MKHFNIFALQGDNETTDEEVCETMGLDPKLAGTPAINEAAIKKMHRENFDGYVKKGADPEKALSMADERADDARAMVKKLISLRNKEEGGEREDE